MKKAKKATAGDRAMLKIMVPLASEYEGSPRWVYRQQCARRIDAAIRRAVRDGFDAGVEYANALRRDNASTDHLSAILARIERKYGVRL